MGAPPPVLFLPLQIKTFRGFIWYHWIIMRLTSKLRNLTVRPLKLKAQPAASNENFMAAKFENIMKESLTTKVVVLHW